MTRYSCLNELIRRRSDSISAAKFLLQEMRYEIRSELQDGRQAGLYL
jgi:hypothetical protein